MANQAGSKSFLSLVEAVDNVPYDFDFSSLYQLLLPDDPRPHGFMLPSIVEKMPWSAEFEVDHKSRTVQLLDSSGGEHTLEACNSSFHTTIDAAIDQDLFASVHGKHSEMYRILGANQFTCLERFTASLFGIAARGAHLTAFVRTTGGLKIWIPRRSPTLFTYPDMLDTTVAGGVKADNTPFECIVAEADEEASLPADFVNKNTVATGVVTYLTRGKATSAIRPDVIYVFDIELPESIVPVPKDGEVAEFMLLSVDEVKGAMFRGEFKPNCNLVMIDFFMRHGIITPENEADYVEIAMRLRRKLPVPTVPSL
ncbi:NUDIX domain-containing protein [Amylocarpus encephaloides]|uniref:NUDIX domain-containing protein n=1 Tax=Amylocarpus encephaloides TaxID=45428 RepID=A0A9P7YIH5_9HELO|nr:NUDIX domain-containing protein [Amylocarpus encephaloides]